MINLLGIDYRQEQGDVMWKCTQSDAQFQPAGGMYPSFSIPPSCPHAHPAFSEIYSSVNASEKNPTQCRNENGAVVPIPVPRRGITPSVAVSEYRSRVPVSFR